MDTRSKLSETNYFLNNLPNVQNNPDEFYYNLSAFLTAWRSVLDVMLYDFAEHFNLRFTREDEMTVRDFTLAARILRNNEATEFILWWKQKQGLLSATPLWRKRNINFHRGRLGVSHYTVYTSGSGGTSNTIAITSGFHTMITGNMVYPEFFDTLVPGAIPTDTTVNTTAPTTNIQTNMEYYFDDLPNQTVIETCRIAYEKIVEIVEEAETKYAITL